MPKIKTISAAKKRFKRTANGKFKRAKANLNHILTHKSASRTRKLRTMGLVHESDQERVERMLVM